MWLALGFWFVRPLWVTRFLPLHDVPNHVARITAYHYLPDAAWNLQPFYERAIGLVPYVAHYYLVHLLTYLTQDVLRANAIFMSAYVLAAPLCGLVFARSLGRNPYLALLLYPLAVGVFFQWGFIAFCVGVMLVLPTVAVLYSVLDAPSRARAVGLSALITTLYLFHVLPWAALGLYLLALVIVELCARRGRGAAYVTLATVPSLALFAIGLLRARSIGYVRAGATYNAVTDTLRGLLRRTTNLLDLWQSLEVDEFVELGLIACIFFLAITDRGDAPDSPRRVRLRLPLALATFVLCAVVAPFWVKRPINWWMINVRFWMLACAFAIFLPRGAIRGARAVLLGAAILSTTALPFYMARAYHDFAMRLSPVIDLLSRTPMGSNTLVVHNPANPNPLAWPPQRRFDDPSLAYEMTIWREIYNYPLILRGGFDPYLYDDGFPIRRIHQLSAPKVDSAGMKVWSPEQTKFRTTQMAGGWDYFLVRDDNLDAMPADGAINVGSRDGWVLLRNLLKSQTNEPDPYESDRL